MGEGRGQEAAGVIGRLRRVPHPGSEILSSPAVRRCYAGGLSVRRETGAGDGGSQVGNLVAAGNRKKEENDYR